MVKTVVLQTDKLMDRETAHEYLKQMLDFPDYYGKNWDALFDCLTDLKDYTIILEGQDLQEQNIKDAQMCWRVLKEAAQANPGLQLIVSPKEHTNS